MSHEDFLPFNCPHCGLDFLAEVWTVINADENPAWRPLIRSGRLNIVACDHCEAEVFVPAPVIYHDSQVHRVACFIPETLEESLALEDTVEGLLAQLAQELGTDSLPAWARHPELVTEPARLVEMAPGLTCEKEVDLTAALQALAAVSSEEELAEVLNAHPELMTAEAHRLLSRVVQQSREQGREEVATYFSNLLDFLSSPAFTGEDPMDLEPLDEAENAEAALYALLQVDSLEEVEEVVEDYPALLSPQAVQSLRRLAYRMEAAGDLGIAARCTTIADLIDDWLTALALEALGEDED